MPLALAMLAPLRDLTGMRAVYARLFLLPSDLQRRGHPDDIVAIGISLCKYSQDKSKRFAMLTDITVVGKVVWKFKERELIC